MLFASPSGPSVHDQSNSFSLDSDFGAPSTDFELDLEKQQQHHLRQFLYFQGLALQRQEEQRRAFVAINENSEVDNFFNNIGTSPDTLSSGSVEDQLQDFITVDSLSNSSVSAPSTPDLLGTNIPTLSGKVLKPHDLACSPKSLTQMPSGGRSASISSSSGSAALPAHDSNLTQTEAQTQMGHPLTQASNHDHGHPVDALQGVASEIQYPLHRAEDARGQNFLFDAAMNVGPVSSHVPAYSVRNRSSSIAMPYMSTYAPQVMPGVYIGNQPTLYQPYMIPAVNAAGMYDGSMVIPIDGGHHQRTFSLPSNNLPMSYGNPAISHPTYHLAQAAPEALEGDTANVDLQRTASIGPQRRDVNTQRSIPYDRHGSMSSRSSLSGARVGVAQMATAVAKSTATSPLPAASGNDDSSASCTPGATVIPENLKDVPVSMIRNPHGGGRGYVPGETPEDPKKKHKCGICGRGFARLYNLKSHASTHDPARPKPYECPHSNCSRSFSRLHDLERHRQGIHRDGPLMDAKEQGITPSVARAQNRIAQRGSFSEAF